MVQAMKKRYMAITFSLVSLISTTALADNENLNAALGGALGGGVGGLVGNAVGGRTGAIVGSGLGAAAGAALTTQNQERYGRRSRYSAHEYESSRERGYYCPPGQAKKGRC
jgi:outer membrane lipoprotein SlyB